MPRSIKKATTASNNTSNFGSTKTAAEIRQIEMEQSKFFADQAKQDLHQLVDYTRNSTKTVSTFNKENLFTYLENITSYASNLRNLSWYLYYCSQTYRRVINYYANMFDLRARNIVPNVDITKSFNDNKMTKSYYQTIQQIDKMAIQNEFLKVYLTCFIQDVFYGVSYIDETGFFILPLPADYCKLVGCWNDGSFCFAFDFSYFRGQREYLVELYGKPFDELYRAYGGNNANRWQIIPEEYSVALKYGVEDWEVVVPPMSGSFASIINLNDAMQLQAVADEQEIYKLIYYKLDTLNGAKDANKFTVSTDVAIEYFNRFIDEALPDYTSAGMVLGGEDLGVIDFSSNDKINDTTKVTKATLEVLNTLGGAQVLNGATITGAEAMRIAQRVDTEYAISSLLGQTEIILNRLMSFVVTDAARIKFFPVSAYTRDEWRDALLTSAQNGSSQNIIAYNSMLGISEKDTIVMQHLVNDILQYPNKLQPLQSSYTQPANADTDPVAGGRPKEDGEATEVADSSQ